MNCSPNPLVQIVTKDSCDKVIQYGAGRERLRFEYIEAGAVLDHPRLNLSRKPPWVSCACQTHNPVWLAAVSGNGFEPRGGPVPCAGLVRDRACRCAEPNRSRSI